MKKVSLYGIFFCVLIFSACQKELTGNVNTARQYTVRITFQPAVNSQALAIGETYQNDLGEDYTVTAFRFYAAYPSLKNNNAALNVTNEKKYRLVDAGISSSVSFTITTADSVFNGLSFQVGVDSIDNVSGAQSGDLDPGKGMFWTWNSGYVMAKLEGTSSFSSMPANEFTYHVGGFSGVNNSIRIIALSTQQVKLNTGHTTDIIVQADINKWFSGVHALKISDNAFVHSPGALAKQYADNYATMFSIAEIVSE
ncbi:MAG: hypothetical protein IT249_09075 [Chitinophagaceae bacterium]|nr:hypothetical protein [Chitinophagaceae bacterium]